MAPKKKKAQQTSKQNGTDSFPGLKSPGSPAAKTHYQELQENELIALEAIYGDDFTQHRAAHSAWQVSVRQPTKQPGQPPCLAIGILHILSWLTAVSQEIRAFV
jgi:hypothetical protein